MEDYLGIKNGDGYNSLLDDVLPSSTWTSSPEKYPSRNSILFKSAKSVHDRHSIFSVTQWFEYIVLTIVAVLIMLIFGWGWAFPLGKPGCGEGHTPSICQLASSLEDGAIQYRVLAAFILGGFVISSVNTWKDRRLAYGKLCNSTRNLILNISACVPSDHMYDKCTMIRWTILAFELCVLKARNTSGTTDAREYLEALNLLEDDEWDMLIGNNENSTVYWWIVTKASILHDNDEISEISFQILSDAVTCSREKGQDLMSRNDRDQPRPYCFICAMLVNLNLLLTSLSKGLRWAILMFDGGGGIFLEPVIYVEIFILFTYNAIFAMLFDLCSALYNPFGPRPIDLPHTKISQEIRRLAKEISIGETPSSMQNGKMLRRRSWGECDDVQKLADLETKLSKANEVLGRSMLLRPGKNVVFHDDALDSFEYNDAGSLA